MAHLPRLRIDHGPRRTADRLARLVERLLPEVGKVYVVCDNLLPIGWRCLYGVGGYTGTALAHELRDYIDPWHGARPAMVLGLRDMADTARRRARHGPPDADTFFSQQAIACCLHEAAHIAGTPRPHYLEHPEPGGAAEPSAGFARAFGPAPTRAALTETKRHHDARFIRAGLHLAYRAKMDAAEVVGDVFRCGDFSEYAAALGDEPERLARLPIVNILGTPAPRALVERFDHDLAAWKQSFLYPGRWTAQNPFRKEPEL